MDNKMLRGAILRELRESRKVNQADIAAAAGVSQQSYQTYEAGRSEPKYDVLCKIADFYDVTADYLLGREKVKQSEEDPEIERLVAVAKRMPKSFISALIAFAEKFGDIGSNPEPPLTELKTVPEAVDDAEAKKDA